MSEIGNSMNNRYTQLGAMMAVILLAAGIITITAILVMDMLFAVTCNIWQMVMSHNYITFIHQRTCPAVAQPGRAFGCRCRPILYADHVKQPIGRIMCSNRRVAGSNKLAEKPSWSRSCPRDTYFFSVRANISMIPS